MLTHSCLPFGNRDADETIAWIAEKDVVLSTDDFGRDLGSVQQLRRKHDGVERDLAALEEKVKFGGFQKNHILPAAQETQPWGEFG